MTFPACSDHRRRDRRAGVAACAAPRARLRAPALLRGARSRCSRPPRTRVRVRAVRGARTSASKACSAPRPARSSATCRSRSASASTTRRRRRRSRRCSPPASSATCASRRRATCWWSSVQERPTISSLTFVGNKEFDTDTLQKALKEIGIAEARIFDRSALDRAEQEMKRQYITRGKYAATVHDHRDAAGAQPRGGQLHHRRRRDAPRSRASTSSATRRSPSASCCAEMSLTTPGWLTWYTKNDQYSQAEAAGRPGDAALLLPEPRLPRVHHRVHAGVDHAGQGGHLHHRSTSPRAPRYTVSDVGSRASCGARARAARAGAGQAGRRVLARAAAGVGQGDQRPPGRRRLRVRQRQRGAGDRPREATRWRSRSTSTPAAACTCAGSTSAATPKTRDEVIRREMRQLEGAWYDGTRIERSKVRMRRLGYFEDGQHRDAAGAGHHRPGRRRRDGHREAHRQPAGRRRLFERRRRRVQRVGLAAEHLRQRQCAHRWRINTSKVNRTISLAFTEPYWTVDGISRTLELYQRNIDPTVARRCRSTRRRRSAAAIGFGVPITETDTINFGVRVEHTKLDAVRRTARRSTTSSSTSSATSTNSYIVSGGWSRDTRDDILYPTRGRLQSALVEVGLPIGDLAYYKLAVPQPVRSGRVYGDFVLMLRGDMGYGDGYGGKPLPFFKAFYAGGVGSVRGYETGSLGPRDIYGNALGGKRKIVGNAELFYPILKGDKSVRLSRVLRRGPDLRRTASSREFENLPLFGRRGPRVELADRPAEVQLRHSRSTTSRRTGSSTSSSRSARYSRRLAAAAETSLEPHHRFPHRDASLFARRRGGAGGRVQDRLRQHRAAVPRGRAGQARAAEAREGVRRARRRDPEARPSRCATCRRCSRRTA